jgi:hypothetical protein
MTDWINIGITAYDRIQNIKALNLSTKSRWWALYFEVCGNLSLLKLVVRSKRKLYTHPAPKSPRKQHRTAPAIHPPKTRRNRPGRTVSYTVTRGNVQ